MKKILLGSLLSISIGYLVSQFILVYFSDIKEPKIKEFKVIKVDSNVNNLINIKQKEEEKKVIATNTDDLNSWKLSATVLGSTSFAMVTKGLESKVIKIEDELEGYKLKIIQKDKVLFVDNKDKTWLYMKSAFSEFSKSNPVAKIMPHQGTYSIRKASFERNILKPENLLKTLNIVPELEGGKFLGLKVKYLLEGSFLHAHGLREGDLIKRVNGKNLVSLSDGIAAYQNVATSKKFSLSVLRDNKIEELKYEVVN